MQKILSTLVLLIVSYHLHAQDFEVSGTVKDPKKQPLPGINVIVKGSPRGTVTNAEGYFTIMVTGGSHTLAYSFIGYKSLEQKIHVTKDYPWELEVTLVAKGLNGKGSAKFIERTVNRTK